MASSLCNLTVFCSQNNGIIKFIFVKESNSMDKVIEELRQIHPEPDDFIDEIDPDECFEIDINQLENKKFLFVFEKFDDSPAFQHISAIPNVFILGPSCVLACIRDKFEVPDYLFHIHNLCMKDIAVCFASIGDPEKKKELKRCIEFMGGKCSNSLTDDIKILVTDIVMSKKYYHAGVTNVKILHPSWVTEIWKESQDINFNKRADDEEFLEKYRLKIFHNIVFSSTGLDVKEKKRITDQIEENGGTYSTTFRTATVKILIMKSKDIGSAKFKASVKHDIKCIDPMWIFDSINAGYAVNPEKYTIKKGEKLKSSTPTKNTSALSKFNFDNTMLSDISDMTAKSIAIDETQQQRSLARASANLQPETSNYRNKSNISKKSKDTTFKRPMKLERKTENFVIPAPPNFEYSEEASDESFVQILIGKTVCIYGYTNDVDSMQVIKECEKFGAKLVDFSYAKQIDYVITPTEILEVHLPNLKYKNVVTDVWLEESVEEGHCIEPLRFYHHSIFKLPEEHQMLKDEIFVSSNYEPQRQRPFVRILTRALGGTSREALCRSDGPILICPAPEGKKFDGARNWGLTVLKAEWLLECYKKRSRCDERDFLVGDTKASSKNLKKRDSIIPCSQEYTESEEMQEIDKSPVKVQNDEMDLPQTPTENEKRIGNISLLLEDMPTPQRNATRSVLLEHQKKSKVSPRTKMLKDLMQTPGNQKNLKDYTPSPAPELPQCLIAPPENYALFPDSSPASQWYYKRKLEACDARYVHTSESSRKALKEVSVTPPYSHARHDFFKRRLADYDSPDPRLRLDDNTEGFFMTRVTANMSNEASKFLNFEDTESDGTQNVNNENKPQDSDLLKLVEVVKKNSAVEKPVVVAQKSSHDVFEHYHENKNIIDYNPKEPEILVRWSNTQAAANEREKLDAEKSKISGEDSDDGMNCILEDNSTESDKNFIFAISSGTNAEEKQCIAEKISKLGGELTEHNFTHLIVTKLTKSSKVFSAMAAGKFVLHSDYIEECLEQNRFVDVEPFEYGNPKFQGVVSEIKDEMLFKGPYSCRQNMKNNPEKFEKGMFSNIKFIVLASEGKLSQFVSVIESGGGIIIHEKPEFSSTVLKRSKIDFCLVESQKLLSKKDINTLQSCDIEVKNIRFIYDYLLTG